MEAFLIIFLVVAFIIVMTTFDIQKKKYYNTITQVLDGDTLSYECQKTGISIDTKQRTIRLFNAEKDKVYSYNNIREINYTLSEAGKYYGNGTLRGMNNAAIVNGKEKFLANQRSGITILTDDIHYPSWKINIPIVNKEPAGNQGLCERWVLVFQKYVL
ncbi:DUF4755 domain-containing protein [Acerihabitans sp. TG2]|uniref:DUF4755 domain-containing protein n=1 Tax=Acerihabitans sp. TG2 TaxID=3096008 RepID=UPI002B227C39|nr:DUF4755 domain-containing protein [Acerihabitans sp. TG2]MEA9392130.1 DUF4755 domain-containing protein [Acerihabitans sp. TG2]